MHCGLLRRSLLHSGLVGDPVHLPGLASVIRERLLKVSGVRSDIRPYISTQNDSTIDCVLAVELASAVLEFADVGRAAQNALPAVGPIEAPLARFWIIK